MGAFLAGGPIVGAEKLDGYLYITTPDRLAIYDVSNPVVPTLVGVAASSRTIYGELISTDGETLLTNNGLTGGWLEIVYALNRTGEVYILRYR